MSIFRCRCRDRCKDRWELLGREARLCAKCSTAIINVDGEHFEASWLLTNVPGANAVIGQARYPEELIDAALAYRVSPFLGALRKNDVGYHLTTPSRTVHNRFLRLGAAFQGVIFKTQNVPAGTEILSQSPMVAERVCSLTAPV